MGGGRIGLVIERVAGEDPLVQKLLDHACVAGACSVWARQEPMAARGLLRAAAFHSARVTDFANAVAAEAEIGVGSAFPAVRRLG